MIELYPSVALDGQARLLRTPDGFCAYLFPR